MADRDRAPCVLCGESTPLRARLCSHCHGTLLVDVRVDGVDAEPRTRYEAARLVESLGDDLDFLVAKGALDAGYGSVAVGVTREDAVEVISVLAELGIQSSSRPQALQPAAPAEVSASRKRALGVGLLVVLGAALGFLVAVTGEDAEESPRSTGAEQVSDAAGEAGTPDLSPERLAELARPATVSIQCPGSQGAGFFVTADRIVTNDHVLCDGDVSPEVVLADGRRLVGTVERREAWLDLAVVRVGGAPGVPLVLGDATAVRQGEEVLIVGNPHGLSQTVAQGIVSHEARIFQGVVYVQIDANVNPGNSGGPLLNRRGEVVGVVTLMIEDGSGLGLAVAANYLYDDPVSLVGSLPNVGDRDRWREWVAQADDADRNEAMVLVDQLERPGLAAAVLRGGAMQAAVVQAGEHEPFSLGMGVSLEAGGSPICFGTLEVERWQRSEEVEAASLDAQARAWLDRHRIDLGVWVGTGPVYLDGCGDLPTDQPLMLALSDAAEGLERAPVVRADVRIVLPP